MTVPAKVPVLLTRFGETLPRSDFDIMLWYTSQFALGAIALEYGQDDFDIKTVIEKADLEFMTDESHDWNARFKQWVADERLAHNDFEFGDNRDTRFGKLLELASTQGFMPDRWRKPKYHGIILAACMMEDGWWIKPDNLKYLRKIALESPCHSHFSDPGYEHGLCEPGRRQFLAALEHYRPGIRRRFRVPSCFSCGKIKDDIGRSLVQCSGCKHSIGAWYCEKDCQKLDWQRHRPTCGIDIRGWPRFKLDMDKMDPRARDEFFTNIALASFIKSAKN
ncbi:hypothetical protein QBC40DRAFT_330057 [Triangularia verruculosa]|uniref:MYND-type domain-containing protein n=1 Tax=Triangularia verruculosa TaxID=2587418 RepID=A0AAN6XEV0_9PEZI|nr:hypothetical protein QBC40DRAFT_330057 [Triangularia verruculosa]